MKRVHVKALRLDVGFACGTRIARARFDILISNGSVGVLGRWWGTGKLVVSCYPKSTYAGVRQRWRAVASTRLKTWLSTMTLCPTRSAAEERSLKRGLLPSYGRIRRDPEGSSRKVDVRRRQDPRVEKTTRTPCLEEMPITTDATTVHCRKRSQETVLTFNGTLVQPHHLHY